MPTIKFKSYEEMFEANQEQERRRKEEERLNNSNAAPLQFPIYRLHPFKHHPFKRYDDAKLEEMTQSVKEHGVLLPILVRPHEGTSDWEIISGHNRVEAAKLAGLEVIPGYSKDVDDNTAAIMMVDSNFNQREKILPSERAFAYKLKLEAIKRQGERRDLTSSQVETKLGRSDELIAQQSDESRAQIQRYIRLTELIPPLLDKVDANKLGFIPAVSLSYLTHPEQEMLNEFIDVEGKTVSVLQAESLKNRAQAGTLDEESMLSIMTDKREPIVKEIKIKYKSIRDYFSPISTPKEIESTILRALKLLREYEAQAQMERHESEPNHGYEDEDEEDLEL